LSGEKRAISEKIALNEWSIRSVEAGRELQSAFTFNPLERRGKVGGAETSGDEAE